MRGREFLDEEHGFHDPWWTWSDYDLYDYIDWNYVEYKTDDSGIVDLSEYMSKSLKRKSLIEKILGETPDYTNTIDKYWPKK
jgi:hypothetical protein